MHVPSQPEGIVKTGVVKGKGRYLRKTRGIKPGEGKNVKKFKRLEEEEVRVLAEEFP